MVEIERVPGVLATSPTVSGAAFAVRGTASKPVLVRGIEPECFDHIIGLAGKTTSGRYQSVGAEAMIGAELAQSFAIALGDKLRIVTATGETDLFTVAGIFDLGAKDPNERLVFVPLRAAQSLFDLAGGVSTIELEVRDLYGAEAVAVEITSRTGLVADSWTHQNPQLLLALRSQASSKDVILAFVTLTVALGIASVLIVSVVQKSREIGVLRAVGTSRARIRRIFLLQGGLVGFGGSVLGSGLGALLARAFVGLSRNPDGSPMFPAEVSPALFVAPTLVATLVGLVAAVAPARRASRLDPAEVIRRG